MLGSGVRGFHPTCHEVRYRTDASSVLARTGRHGTEIRSRTPASPDLHDCPGTGGLPDGRDHVREHTFAQPGAI